MASAGALPPDHRYRFASAFTMCPQTLVQVLVRFDDTVKLSIRLQYI